MKRKIAIPIDIFGHLERSFGHSKWFALMDIEGSDVVFAENIEPPPHEPGLLPKWLAESGVTDIIAGEIGENAIHNLNKYGINTFTRVPHLKISQLVAMFTKGELVNSSEYSQP